MNTSSLMLVTLDGWDYERHSLRKKAAHRRRRRLNREKRGRRLHAEVPET